LLTKRNPVSKRYAGLIMHYYPTLQFLFTKLRRAIMYGMPLLLFSLSLIPDKAHASIPNHLYRIDIRPHEVFTRITVRLEETPQYILSIIPGNRLRLVIQDTGGPLFKKLRHYSDKNIGGLVIKKRGDSLLVTFQISQKAGWRDLTRPDVSAITVDVGSPFKHGVPQPSFVSRERISNGVEKLVRDFDPPLKSEIPFTQTDRQVLKTFLAEEDQKDFMAAEAALYKGRLTEAEELFSRFSSRQTSIRPLALYRLAETWYKLQKYPQALAAFREAERLWPDYLRLNPGVTFYYGDSIARSGELVSARVLLAGLVARLADKTYAPALLVRLGDILTRQGHEHEAHAIYQNVADNFKDNKASQMALMRIADNDFMQSTPWNYRSIRDIYLNASRQSGDLDMREEAYFKYVLLESIHGEAGEALQQVMGFERKFPRGVYVAVIRTIREVLVAEVFRSKSWINDSSELVRFLEEQHEYLASCVEQPGFLTKITRAYNEAGRPIELVKLLSAMVERSWAASVAPELYISIADNAELIGDTATAERSIKSFLGKFSTDPRARQMTERLGSIYYAAGKHLQVKETLLWLLNKGEHPKRTESYYQLGRSLYDLRLFKQAIQSMELYIAASSGRNPQLLPDAYFVDASARENSGDIKGALRLFEIALKLPENSRNEEFTYRTGQINLHAGNKVRAKLLFEQLAKSAKDPDWQKLAQQALVSFK
jgi:TolA-binding protein